MTQPKRARSAAPSKGAAARAEKTPAAPVVAFRGVTIPLPKVLPGTLYFDLAAIGEQPGDPTTQVRLLDSLIGSDQVEIVRAKIAEDEVPFAEMPVVLDELFESVMAAYGMSTGESSASPES